jgi:hypothetical protein
LVHADDSPLRSCTLCVIASGEANAAAVKALAANKREKNILPSDVQLAGTRDLSYLAPIAGPVVLKYDIQARPHPRPSCSDRGKKSWLLPHRGWSDQSRADAPRRCSIWCLAVPGDPYRKAPRQPAHFKPDSPSRHAIATGATARKWCRICTTSGLVAGRCRDRRLTFAPFRAKQRQCPSKRLLV